MLESNECKIGFSLADGENVLCSWGCKRKCVSVNSCAERIIRGEDSHTLFFGL